MSTRILRFWTRNIEAYTFFSNGTWEKSGLDKHAKIDINTGTNGKLPEVNGVLLEIFEISGKPCLQWPLVNGSKLSISKKNSTLDLFLPAPILENDAGKKINILVKISHNQIEISEIQISKLDTKMSIKKLQDLNKFQFGVVKQSANSGELNVHLMGAVGHPERHFPAGDAALESILDGFGIIPNIPNSISTNHGSYNWCDIEFPLKIRPMGFEQYIKLHLLEEFDYLRLGHLFGCNLTTGSNTSGGELYFHLDCTWLAIPNENTSKASGKNDILFLTEADIRAWINQEMSLVAKVRTELVWLEPEKPQDKGADVGNGAHPCHSVSSLLAACVEDPRKALLSVAGNQPQSFLPEFIFDGSTWFSISGPVEFFENLPGEDLEDPEERKKLNTHGVLSLGEKPFHVSKVGKDVWAKFPGFDTSNQLLLKLARNNDTAENIDEIPVARLAMISSSSNPPMAGRLGALDFHTSSQNGSMDSGKPIGTLLLKRSEQTHGEYQKGNLCLGAELTLELPVDQVVPVTADLPRGERERGTAPLLLSIPQQKGKFYLKIQESAFRHFEDWHLKADLYDQTSEDSQMQGVKPDTYTLLAYAPFSFLRFARLPLALSGDDRNAIVAQFDSDRRTWEFKIVQPNYHYVLPPQSVGESSDKPRRLEIHDLKDEQKVVRPYPGDGKELSGKFPLKSHLIEWRLTPSAEFWIRPSDLDRGYFLPEWAAHDIFRQRNDFGLGAALLGLRAEFLYGLSVGLEVAAEEGATRFARLAEVEALTGRLPSHKKQDQEKPKILESWLTQWEELHSAMVHRSERLEAWVLEPGSERPFAPAQFTHGVRFALRSSALHRTPTLNPAWETIEEPKLETIRHSEHGLAGGALWPLESWYAFEQLKERPDSIGGTLENVAFGPMGGDADQKAVFLNGLLTVVSETRMGHVQRQRVEVLGRIGALWHRAKHVIIYERTVNPTAQFAPKHDEDPSRTRSRRPILRKVREFVEVIQPERRYPDFSAEARTVGCLRGVRFNSRVMNVDSAWGRDVGMVGYEIPLWNRLSARERPQVYPMPDTAFLTAGEGEPDALSAQLCLDPDRLYFFTDLSSHQADTDSWPSRLSVDTLQTLSPSRLLQLLDDEAAEHERPKAAPPRSLPGYGRFTWRLAPASQRTRINAERGDKPLFAGLESITFLRTAPDLPEEKKYSCEGLVTALKDIVPLHEAWLDDGPATPGSAAAVFQSFREAVEVKDKTNAALLLEKLREKVQEQRDLVSTGSKHFQKLEEIRKNTPAFFADGKLQACEALKSKIQADLARKRLLIEQTLRHWHADLASSCDTWIDGIDPLPEKVEDLIQLAMSMVADQIKEVLRGALHGGYSAARKLASQVASASAIVLDAEEQMTQAVRLLRGHLQQILSAYQDDKPWSANRLAGLEEQLHSACSGLALDLRAAVEEARLQLAQTLSASANALVASLGQALGTALEALPAFQQLLAEGKGLLSVVLSRLQSLKQKLAVAQTKIKEAETKAAENYKTILEEMKDLCARAQNSMDSLEQKAKELQSGGQQTHKILDELSKFLAKQGESAVALIVETTEKVGGLADDLKAIVLKELQDAEAFAKNRLTDLWAWGKLPLVNWGEWADRWVAALAYQLDDLLLELRSLKDRVFPVANDWLKKVEANLVGLTTFVENLPDKLVEQYVVPPIGKQLKAKREDLIAALASGDQAKTNLKIRFREFADELDQVLTDLAGPDGALSKVELTLDEGAKKACQVLSEGLDDITKAVEEEVEKLKMGIEDALNTTISGIEKQLQNEDFDGIIKEFGNTAKTLKEVFNGVSTVGAQAGAFGHRLLENAAQLGSGGLETAPGKLLKLYAAATSAPELPMLATNTRRLQCAYDELGESIRTTRADAYLAKLGDALKSIGLRLPFDRLGGGFQLDKKALEKIKLGQFFKNFGGLDLKGLFPNVKAPANLEEAVKLSHDFDATQGRAWVQLTVDVDLGGRSELFSVGPFSLYFTHSRFYAIMRLEASKDREKVAESGYSELVTNIEAVVSGEVMVSLDRARLIYTKEKGLRLDLDPRRIRINPVFRFVQDTLGSLFPNKIFGLDVIKDDRGIPVGLEHQFAMPPMSLAFGTSGVSNIAISNRFRLLAFPDFMLSDRFNLSTVETPFVFSFFILGGTGYIQVETEYRPFDQRLMVMVEAAAGASASLSFAFGPIQGSVYITLSVALTYRKLSDRPSGNLAVGLVLVIGGRVCLWGMAHLTLALVLRMTYRDDGRIDASGTLKVELEVSRFLTLRYRRQITYKLRDGKGSTTSKEGWDAESPALEEKMKALKGTRGA